MDTLEFISYNIEVGKKFDDVVAWIAEAELAPDIFCFQEFPESRLPSFEAFLEKRDYKFIYAPSVIIGKIQVGELTAYKTSRLDLVAHKELALGNYFWERRHKRLRGQRTALLTLFQYKKTKFALANIHLSVFSPHSMRYKQLKIIIDELQNVSENKVVIGDFNYTSLFGVKRLFKFMEHYGLTCVGERLITHKIFRRIPQQLDYVFQKGFGSKEISVHKVPHSDHLPLAVVLEL